MDSKNSVSGVTRSRVVALIATMSVCAAYCTSALSATQAEDCDKVARGLKHLDTPVEILSASPVEHVSIEPGATVIESPDVELVATETVTPFLYLTPRVASVLRNVFDSTHSATAADSVADLPSSSPLAETEDVSKTTEGVEEVAPSSEGDGEIYLPSFQRQMYRIDI